MRAALLLTLLTAVALTTLGQMSDVVLQTDHLQLVIGADGMLKSLTARPTGSELAWTAQPLSIATVYRGGRMTVGSQEAYAEHDNPAYRGGRAFPATRAALTGDRLRLEFGEGGTTATCKVTVNPDYLAFELLALEGEPIDRIDLVQLRIKRLPFLGPWIDVAYDDQFGICLCAGNIKTDAAMSQEPAYVEMRALATRQVALQGATAVLFGCPDPKQKFLDRMEILERDFHMPPGARNRRSPVEKYSYLWCNPTPADIDRYIALAKRAGLRMILFSYSAFTRGAGHFQFNSQFPRGIDDLRDLTDRIRAAGLKVGLHLHYSKADRTDPYVTPVPDNRLHKVRTFTLAEAVDGQADSLQVQENPEGCTRVNDRRLLKIGKELIAYRDYTGQPPYRFVGCERGYLHTGAGSHQSGEALGLLDVDDWTRFIRFDQTTDIQDEAAGRIAEIANASGPYDLVYFDGAEDVHDPFWYHVAHAQYRVYQRLQPAPPVCEAAMSGHFSWHFITGGQAYDLAGQHVKNFCHEISCRTAPIRALEFTRINFGWVFPFHREIGPDILEYVLSRGAAWDCPFSLRASLADVAANPRAEDCLDVIKTWEDARIGGKLTESQRGMLKTLDPGEYRYVKVWDAVFAPQWIQAWSKTNFCDQEHHLFKNERGQDELVPVREVPGVADGRVKAFLFQRSTEPGVTYVLVWAKEGELELTLPLSPARLTVMRPFGSTLPPQRTDSSAVVRVGTRRYLRLDGVGTDEAVGIIRGAKAALARSL